MATTRESLEFAIAADPNNHVIHAAYADLLIEEGDPRGEHIRLELLRSDAVSDLNHLSAIIHRSWTIRKQHEVEWLGPLFPFAETGKARPRAQRFVPPIDIDWRYGSPRYARINDFEPELIAALKSFPLRNVVVEYEILPPPKRMGADRQLEILQMLIDVPFRILRLQDFSTLGDRLIEWVVAEMLPHRHAKYVFNGCQITDEGARILAGSPHVGNANSFNLDRNHLTQDGVDLLKRAGVGDVGVTFSDYRYGWSIEDYL